MRRFMVVTWCFMLFLSGCQGASIPSSEDAVLEASGIIQAEQVLIASEFGGLVAEFAVAETSTVQPGDVLLNFDTAVVDAEIESMAALVAVAEAGVAQAYAGARPTQRVVAEAQLAQAETGLLAARQAVSDTETLIASPQDLDLQIAVTRAQIEAARHREAQSAALKDYAESALPQAAAAVAEYGEGGRYRFPVSWQDVLDQLPLELVELLPTDPTLPPGSIPDGDYTLGDWELVVEGGQPQLYKWVDVHVPELAHLAPHYAWQAWIGLTAANITREGLEAQLADLYARRANPQTLISVANTALTAQEQLEAQIAMAQAQVMGMQTGLQPADLAALEARLAQAQAGLTALQQKREMLTLRAPVSGTVVSLAVHRGEVAAAGATLVTLADLSRLTLTVYVPQTQLGQVYLGQPATITVDSFPERVFAGSVSHIADTAEFTPRNVATKEERVNLVFAVTLEVLNPDGALKPGMPADVVLP
ncbi:MAG: efflux RND transporter periplasmic adaptor subunit [Anaerolineae bacterium]|nr:efflux RND transporter periplasmic adaptor subunit [Anaerolineae bacterium]